MNSQFDLPVGASCWLSERALLIGVASSRDARALCRAVRAELNLDVEVVPALGSVLVEAHRVLDPRIADLLRDGGPVVAATEGRDHLIEVVLDGEDVAEVCALTSTTLTEMAAVLAGTTFEVGAMGFSPGFGYLLGELGPLSTLGRRPTPRPRVPAGSLATAAGQLALYPGASPGGWWLLGRSAAPLFDPSRDRPSLLEVGDRVRFAVVDELGAPPVLTPPTPLAGPGVLRVRAAPPGVVVVDDGRWGFADIGVGPSGPFDPERAHDVRRLLGGAPGVLEVPGPGLELEVLEACTVASLGLEVVLDGRTLPEGRPIHLSAGTLSVQGVRGGRGYLGVAGGPIVPRVLGSMATSMLSGLGPGYLSVGDDVRAAPTGGYLARVPSRGTSGVLRVMPGPHVEVLEGGPAALDGLEVDIIEPSNRVGLRMRPTGGPLGRHRGEVTSIPVITGAVQVPADGMPVVLGPDRATLGGYPVVACVIGADLGRLGRCAVGDRVQLRVVDLDEARRLGSRGDYERDSSG